MLQSSRANHREKDGWGRRGRGSNVNERQSVGANLVEERGRGAEQEERTRKIRSWVNIHGVALRARSAVEGVRDREGDEKPAGTEGKRGERSDKKDPGGARGRRRDLSYLFTGAEKDLMNAVGGRFR